MATFTLTIELGNEAMQDGDDIARAIGNLVDHPYDGIAALRIGETGSGRVMDSNGNTVGQWSVTE